MYIRLLGVRQEPISIFHFSAVLTNSDFFDFIPGITATLIHDSPEELSLCADHRNYAEGVALEKDYE